MKMPVTPASTPSARGERGRGHEAIRKSRAVAAGVINSEITRMLPTALNDTTTVSAVSASSRMSSATTGRPIARAPDGSNDAITSRRRSTIDSRDHGCTDGDGQQHVARVRAEGIPEEDAFKLVGADVVIGEYDDAERERGGEDDAD